MVDSGSYNRAPVRDRAASSMNALVFGGPWELTVARRPEPPMGSLDVLIEVVATGICGSDLHGYTGDTGRRHEGQVMGHETVGRIVQVGGEVRGLDHGVTVTVNPIIGCGQCAMCGQGMTNVCPSHRVIGVDPTIDGAFADRVVVPASNVVPLSNAIPVLQGALVEPLAVGYHAACRAAVSSGDRVLVIGGGPIGQACAIAAARLEADSILVSEPTSGRRRLVEKLGFAVTSPDALREQAEDLLGGAATVVIDAVGIDASLADALDLSERQASIVLVGMGAQNVSLAAYPVSVGERRLIGSYCYTEEQFRSTADWVSAGQPILDPLIDGQAELHDGPAAFRSLADGSSPANKIVLLPAGGSAPGPP